MARFEIVKDPVSGTALVGELRSDGVYVHLDPPLKKMSPDDYRDLLMLFKDAKDYIKGMGFDSVNVFIPEDDKLIKFEAMFGFSIVNFYTDQKGNKYVHMRQEV